MKIAVLDCNNFFVSCERVFRPDLQNKPVIVLSNNDGCVVSRSNEAKALNIPMGIPYFKVREIVDRHKISVFSSNFTLYSNMSSRVMSCLKEMVPNIEIYSVDEAFFEIEDYKKAVEIQKLVSQSTGIPVSIGIGQTKTQSKAANEIAKKNPELKHVFEIKTLEDLKKIPIEDVWGIGRQYSKFLQARKISTAYDLAQKSDDWVKQNLKITGLKTVLELRGTPCIELNRNEDPRKSILASRSFGRPIKTLPELKESVAMHVMRAGNKLRSQNLATQNITTFIMTNKHYKPFYYNSETTLLLTPTSNTFELIKFAHQNLEKIFKSNLLYKKAGIRMSILVPERPLQTNLIEPSEKYNPSTMLAMDYINEKWGQNTIIPAAIGFKKTWRMKSEQISRAYTTRWEDLPIIT